jgi:hypothetical protein
MKKTAPKRKSVACSKVLQLMDEDYGYEKALKIIRVIYPKVDIKKLEKELDYYV